VIDGYYNTAAGSIGLQIGAESKALVFLFMTQDALDRFRAGEGWAGGVDASVALFKVGANGDVDVIEARAPTLAFVMTNSGLMANLSLEGTKVTRIHGKKLRPAELYLLRNEWHSGAALCLTG
jgi:lipid-binding SYLF domain-containing protein